MRPLLSHSIKAGLLALGLAAGLSAPTFAGPMPQTVPSVPSTTSAPEILPVREGWAGTQQREMYWPRNNRRHWNGERWRHHNDWRRDRWRHHNNWRRHHRHYNGSGIYFGLGALGIGPAYDYYAPRRTYRVYRGSNAHVRYCYNRYRSYRASDNTFQPYNGPRRQCRSPYR